MRPQVKICGLTRIEEAAYLNEAAAEYAGFVFYPKSKRNLSIEEAEKIMKALSPSIKKVAVLVSPKAEEIKRIEDAGFDILQIHKELYPETYAAAEKPLWRAINIANAKELQSKQEGKEETKEKGKLAEEDPENKIGAYLIDGENFGSGQTFDWSAAEMVRKYVGERSFILAGGLNPDNIEEAIRLFAPDIVDVSSGVEASCGKDKNKILEFVRKARKNG